MCFQETLAHKNRKQHTTCIQQNKQEVIDIFSLIVTLLAQPVFGPLELVYFNEIPLDSGFGSAPYLVDWNGDGLTDILLGTRMPYEPLSPYVLGGVYYLPNTGTPDSPLFEAAAVLLADGKPINHGT